VEEIREEIAKIVPSSGDCYGATWEELRKIDKLVRLFKLYYYLIALDSGLIREWKVGW